MTMKWMAIATGTLLSLVSLLALTNLTAGPATAQVDLLPALSDLNLTDQQQADLDALRQQTRAQVETILTSEQEEQLLTAWTEREGLRQAIATLNLTPQQRDQLRQVFQSARSEFGDILTPEQQQQLRRTLQDWAQQR